MGRFCKTCAHLRRIPVPSTGRIGDPNDIEVFRCGYSVTIPAPWPVMQHIYAPDFVVGPRHVVAGSHYPEVRGSTADWTEVMDCPTHKPKEAL